MTDAVGLPMLKDTMAELAKPGRDTRECGSRPSVLQRAWRRIEDVLQGIKPAGVVTNITVFAAIIDIDVHRTGLAHLSWISDRFIKDPNEAVKVNQKVMAIALEVAEKKNAYCFL